VSWKVIALKSWEPNFRRWVIDGKNTPAQDDSLGNQLWYCNKHDIFPIREVKDESWKKIIWILCGNFNKCRICPNTVPTIYDETEFILEEFERIRQKEWKKEAERHMKVRQFDIESRLKGEWERLEFEQSVRDALVAEGYQKEA